MWVIIIVKFYCGGNFGEMQFELPLQLDTERYFMQRKSLYLTRNVFLSFFARSNKKFEKITKPERKKIRMGDVLQREEGKGRGEGS